MADISYIHSNKLAKWNYEYRGKDGTIYIGQKDGRLKKKEAVVAASTVTTAPTTSETTISGSTGDIEVTTVNNNTEIKSALMPFLLMGS